MRRKFFENEKNKTTFIKEAQNFLKIKVALFLWFCDFWVLKYQSEKSWLWGRGAPRDLNQITWDQVRRGFFYHVYEPWNLQQIFSDFMCPNVHIQSFKKNPNLMGLADYTLSAKVDRLVPYRFTNKTFLLGPSSIRIWLIVAFGSKKL